MKRKRKHFVPLSGEDQSYVLGATLKKSFMDIPPPKTRGRFVKGIFIPAPKPPEDEVKPDEPFIR
jgi:hypothetical protein